MKLMEIIPKILFYLKKKLISFSKIICTNLNYNSTERESKLKYAFTYGSMDILIQVIFLSLCLLSAAFTTKQSSTN